MWVLRASCRTRTSSFRTRIFAGLSLMHPSAAAGLHREVWHVKRRSHHDVHEGCDRRKQVELACMHVRRCDRECGAARASSTMRGGGGTEVRGHGSSVIGGAGRWRLRRSRPGDQPALLPRAQAVRA